jgi:ubiquinone/menaquinone biosynthesis C-methylase UbiE
LPLCDGAVDDVLAAFVLNHLDDPPAGLTELARVTRPDGALLASVYSTASRSAARDRVDGAAHAHGFAFPAWYLEMKANVTPLLGSAVAMGRAAAASGWRVHEVVEHAVDVGVRTASELVDYRFGQALYAAWLAGLAPIRRRAVRQAVIDEVSPVMEPYRPIVVLLAATGGRAGAQEGIEQR